MTFKFVGALKGITDQKPHVMKALQLGLLLGLIIETVRKLLKNNRRYRAFSTGSRTGRVTDFVLDAFIIPSPVRLLVRRVRGVDDQHLVDRGRSAGVGV